ncbi:MAG: hypothetical protein ACRYG8_49710 [Janthinobacterium lividum]
MHSADTVDVDTFSVTRARQMLAMLDRDTDILRDGDILPRGWHSTMFAPATRPSDLRPDGFGGLGIAMPPTDLTRLMFGGRRIALHGDLAIGAPARRHTSLVRTDTKQGRSGRLLIVTLQRDIYGEQGTQPLITEQQDYILREPAGPPTPEPPGPGLAPGGTPFVADEQMLFRYCALTFNTHRIHYDLPYATAVEGYEALVVNGNLTVLMLTEAYRAQSGSEPRTIVTRNVRPLLCGRNNRLRSQPGDSGWRLWAEDDEGRLAVETFIT